MNRTKIEWVKNPDGTQGYTWNPITGCLNGCAYCYARKLANGRLRSRYLANDNISKEEPYSDPGQFPFLDPFYPRFWEDRVRELQRGIDDGDYERYIRQKAKGIFVCDMSDLFGIGIPEEWTSEIMATIGDDGNSQHRFYLLTKQPQNLIKWSPFPPNCYVGVTATDPTMLVEAYNRLICIDAKVKFVSLEPLLSWGNLEQLHACNLNFLFSKGEYPHNGIDWVIIGALTKPYKPPKIEWVEEIVRACDKAGVPVFLKDNLKSLLVSSINGQDVIESHNLWAFKEFKLRQEFPIGHNREAV